MKELRERTRRVLLACAEAYPLAEPQDILKLLHQSSYGCGHLVPSREAATEFLCREAEETADTAPDGRTFPLAGPFVRLPLTALREGLSPRTLGALFALSAEKSGDGDAGLAVRLEVARELACEGSFGFGAAALDAAIAAWEQAGTPAVRHSETYRSAYRPAYRVICEDYVAYLPLLTAIDRRMAEKGRLILAIEGGSATGKTTLAALLHAIYGCTVFHMDDFFLRPEQRTPERFAEPGGNVDRERFLLEVLTPLCRGEKVAYRRFDCATQTVLPPVDITPTPLTVIEGAYCMHPDLAEAYGLAVYLEASDACQRERILHRNSPAHAARFFSEWIPLERRYFEAYDPKSRCTLTIEAKA